jgi:hypothetical protein
MYIKGESDNAKHKKDTTTTLRNTKRRHNNTNMKGTSIATPNVLKGRHNSVKNQLNKP